jgi:serine/threonine protein kinase/tetratricopeptide (TPR) repeat protein
MTHCPHDQTALVRFKPARSWTGRVLDGRFEIGAVIASGGMGTVYLGRQLSIDRQVAIKIIKPSFAEDREIAKRFLREARLASRLAAPNVVATYDFGQTGEGELYLVMELVRGHTLAKLLAAMGRLPTARVTHMAIQLCDALHAAHREGIVHRDLKPGNIMVLDEPPGADALKVLDFGLAKSVAGEATTAITRTDAQLGTPLYMAPEQVQGETLDARTDLYALGCILYEMLSGRPPFVEPSITGLLAKHVYELPPPLPADVKRPLAEIVMRLLEKKPAARFASAADVRAELVVAITRGSEPTLPLPAGATPAPRPRPRRSIVLASALGGLLAFGGVATYLATRERATAEPARPPVAHADTASTAAPVPPGSPVPATGTTRVMVATSKNLTKNPVLDRVVDNELAASIDNSTRLDRISRVELLAVEGELEAQGVTKPADERVAQRIAQRDRVSVIILTTTIRNAGTGVSIEVIASDAQGNRISTSALDAATLAQVPTIAMRLGRAVRRSLGENVREDEREECRVSPDLDAAYEFAVAESMMFPDLSRAIEHFERAVKKDPVFPLARLELAGAYLDAGRLADGQAQQQLVLRSLDRLSERSRLTFLGDYYFTTTRDYDRAVKSYEQLLARWPHDADGLATLPMAYEAVHDLRASVAASELATKRYPNDLAIRTNACGYMLEGGESQRALDCVHSLIAELPDPDPFAWRILTRAAALAGHHDEAVDALAKLAQRDAASGAAYAADLAIADGRPAEAQTVLERQLAADVAAKATEAAAIDRELLAEARWRRGDRAGARAAVTGPAALDPTIACVTALVLAESGADAAAAATAARFAASVPRSTRALGKLIEGERLRASGDANKAMIAFQDALHLDDVVLGHLLLARAAIDARHFPEAYGELQTCTSRRNELATTALGGLRFAALVPYYLAKAKEGLGNSDTGAAYRAYLESLHDPDPGDPLVVDARNHAR